MILRRLRLRWRSTRLRRTGVLLVLCLLVPLFSCRETRNSGRVIQDAFTKKAVHDLEKEGHQRGAEWIATVGRSEKLILPRMLSRGVERRYPRRYREYEESRERLLKAFLRKDWEQVIPARRAAVALHLVSYELETDSPLLRLVDRYLAKSREFLESVPAPEEEREIFFSVAPERIARGETAVLRWRVPGKSTVHLNGLGVSPEGETVVHPVADAAYELSCQSADFITSRTLVLSVLPPRPVPPRPSPPKILLRLRPREIRPGEAVLLQWRTSGADTVTFEGKTLSSYGTMLLTPKKTRSFSIEAEGAGGRARNSVRVTVVPVEERSR